MEGNRITVGTCSFCGGPVLVPTSSGDGNDHCRYGKCAFCGAVAAGSYGPVIPMRPMDMSWQPYTGTSTLAPGTHTKFP